MHRDARIAACVRLAGAFSRGEALPARELPAAAARDVTAWRERVVAAGVRLSREEWLLGLLTVSCLADAVASETTVSGA
jgi:hypothetical protein